MTTDSSVLAWRTPWTEKPGGLQSKGGKESDTTRHVVCQTLLCFDMGTAGPGRAEPPLHQRGLTQMAAPRGVRLVPAPPGQRGRPVDKPGRGAGLPHVGEAPGPAWRRGCPRVTQQALNE